MSEHLAPEQLNALADGEVIGAELDTLQIHLAGCPACTSAALAASLTKRGVGQAGMHHVVPDDLKERMRRLAAGESGAAKRRSDFSMGGWGAIAAALILGVGLLVASRQMQTRSADDAVVAEVADQHIAAMAGNAPPQVISSDRHTVKPWFQGKLPFSFNLPENLPADTTLDGADLTYLNGLPTAQLMYSIGKHHVSVFLRQTNAHSGGLRDRAGFHVERVPAGELEVVAVSDVEVGRLRGLAEMVAQAQAAR